MPSDRTPNDQVTPWFAGRVGVVLMYRINRRPLPQPDLFAQQPESFLDHLVEVLLFGGEPVVTGRATQREWLLGNREIREDQGLVAGHVGWRRHRAESSAHYEDAEARWVDDVAESEISARAPFVVDAESQMLAVVQHPTFSEKVIAHVFTKLLERGEAARTSRSTEWAVEPLLDEEKFREWVTRTDAVEELTFVAKIPNPDALEEFQALFDRMQRLQAAQIREVITARDKDTGLTDIFGDDVSSQFISMASRAYGYILGKGRKQGKQTKYDQRRQVRRQRLDHMPETWSELLTLLINFIAQRRAS